MVNYDVERSVKDITYVLHHQPDQGEQAGIQQCKEEGRGELHPQQQHRDNFPDRKVRGTQWQEWKI